MSDERPEISRDPPPPSWAERLRAELVAAARRQVEAGTQEPPARPGRCRSRTASL